MFVGAILDFFCCIRAHKKKQLSICHTFVVRNRRNRLIFWPKKAVCFKIEKSRFTKKVELFWRPRPTRTAHSREALVPTSPLPEKTVLLTPNTQFDTRFSLSAARLCTKCFFTRRKFFWKQCARWFRSRNGSRDAP